MKIDCSINYIKKAPSPTDKYAKYRKDWNDFPTKHFVSEFPIHLDIELTNRCNLKCPMCAFHSDNALFPQQSMDMNLDLFKKIIDEGANKGLIAIKLNFSGEPLLYPHLIQAIKYAKKKGILDVMFNTNGTLLTEFMTKELVKSGLDKIIFSDYLERSLPGKIKFMQQFKELHNKRNPIVRVQRLIYPGLTVEETGEYLEATFPEADELATQMMLDYNNTEPCFKWSDFECAYPWQRMLILANGMVLTCCGVPNTSKVVGSAKVDSIKEIWHGKYMSHVRLLTDTKMTHQIAGCSVCPMRKKIIEDKND